MATYKSKTSQAVPIEMIQRRIYLIRGSKVMLDQDLAELYGVSTGNLNLAVRRNHERFPEDFMFRLNTVETKALILQIARSKGRGGRRHSPYAFTEQGVAMLSSILKTKWAVLVNIVIMRAFAKLRELVATHRDILQKLAELERKYERHNVQISDIFDAIRRLVEPSARPLRRIGFTATLSRRSH